MNKIDSEIFSGSDHPFDVEDEVYEWFHSQIEQLISDGLWGDRCFVTRVDVLVAMLHRLSSYYGNVRTKREQAIEWQRLTLAYFDTETEKRGDAAKVAGWRKNIIANFARLKHVLRPTE